MPYAIEPRGAGKPVGFRAIKEGWPLKDGETFTVDEDPRGKVLAENGRSLRDITEDEITAAFLAERRATFVELVKRKAVALTAAQVPALNSIEMIEFLAEIWPHLVAPGDNATLTYVRAVVVKARGLITTINGATLQQLAAFDVDAPPGGWPSLPA